MSERKINLLILGGTTEAAALAARLEGSERYQVVSSLAGATRHPAAIAGRVRRGGFGGAEGLADYFGAEHIERVIDATHPFATAISGHAEAACGAHGIPLLRLERPLWAKQAGDRWIEVSDLDQAARALGDVAKRVLLTVGRKELDAFAASEDIWFLVRMIEAPDEPPPLARHELLLGRGPFELDSEIALLRQHAIEALVSKNSGGEATVAKIAAARELGLPVIMVQRPSRPSGAAVVGNVDAAVAWLEESLSA